VRFDGSSELREFEPQHEYERFVFRLRTDCREFSEPASVPAQLLKMREEFGGIRILAEEVVGEPGYLTIVCVRIPGIVTESVCLALQWFWIEIR
jgi:hypothetical protein